MAEKIKLFELDIDADALIKKMAETKQRVDELKKSQKELDLSSEEGRVQFVRNSNGIKKLTQQYRIYEKASIEVGNKNKNLVKTQNAINREIKKEVSSIAGAREQNARLLKLRNRLNLKTKEGRLEQEKMNKKIDENNNFIKGNVDQLSKQKIGIGGYSEALKGLTGKISIFGVSLATITTKLKDTANGLKAQKIATESSAKSVSLMSKVLRVFKIALISTGIGAILVLLGSLVAYLSTTQKGINAVNRVLIPLRVLFESLFGVIQDLGGALVGLFTNPQKSIETFKKKLAPFQALFDLLKGVVDKVKQTIIDAFNNPQEAVIKLWNVIKTNLINRITGIGGIFKALGKIISSGFTDGYKDLANATIQTTTGIEDSIGKVTSAIEKVGDAVQPIVKATIDGIKNISNQVSTTLGEAIKRGTQIAKLKEEYSRQEADFIIQQSRLNEEFKAQNKIGEDQTKTLEEREKAIARSIEVQNELFNLRNKRLGLEIKIQQLENKSSDTSDKERAELAQLVSAQNDAKATQLEAETTQQNKLNTIRTQSAKQQYNLIQQEITDFKNAGETKIKHGEYISDALFNIEKTRLETQRDFELDFIKKAYQEKLITHDEYLADIKKANETHDKSVKGLEDTKDKADKNKNKADLENEKTLKALQFAEQINNLIKQGVNKFDVDKQNAKNELELKKQSLEQERADRIEKAIQTGEDINTINQLFDAEILDAENETAKTLEEIEKAKARAKVDVLVSGFNTASELLGKETLAGKAAAVAGATINTYAAATKALVDFPGPLGFIAAATAIATGLANVSKIVSVNAEIPTKKVNAPKFAKGGAITIGGDSHERGGTTFTGTDGTVFEAEKDESLYVLNKNAPQIPVLSMWNKLHGGDYFHNAPSKSFLRNGGKVAQPSLTVPKSLNLSNQSIEQIANAVAQIPPPNVRVAVEDIQNGINNYTEIVSNGNI